MIFKEYEQSNSQLPWISLLIGKIFPPKLIFQPAKQQIKALLQYIVTLFTKERKTTIIQQAPGHSQGVKSRRISGHRSNHRGITKILT